MNDHDDNENTQTIRNETKRKAQQQSYGWTAKK